MNQLRIFISSTCYDLVQIRADLFDFISGLGYQPILSEYTSFPIDPDTNTVDNCIQNVEASDILILIIGGRYGHVVDSEKSITNTEYLYARQRGIPVYIFIYKPLVTIFPVWSQNKEADFTQTVDSPKVFEFIEDLRLNNKNWCFEFEKAQHITSILKIQFSHLFKDSLDLRKKIRISDQPEFYKFLSPKAVNIALKKDLYYEPLFFAQVLKDELEKHENLKLDLEYKILLSCKRQIKDPFELNDWLGLQMKGAENLIQSVNNIYSDAFPYFFGEPGVPSDLKGLYYVAYSLAQIFKEMVEWSLDIKSVDVHEDFISIRDNLSTFMMEFIDQIWEYPDNTINTMLEARKTYEETGAHPGAKAVLTLTMGEGVIKVFTEELARITQKLQSGFYN